MPTFESGSSPHRWNQIRRLPLNSDIHSLQDYEDAVISGTLDCVAFLRRIRPLDVLTMADFQQAHHQMFKRAHPWAGRFRTPGQMVTIAGLPAADAPRIARELELAWFQTRELIVSAYSAADPQEMLAALAFLHVRFERVHPFLDGNGRVGRALLRVQMEKAFGIGPGFTDQTGYRTSLRASSRKDLAPLMNYLGVPVGLSMVNQPWIAPFQVAPRFLEDVSAAPTFEDDVAWSRL